MSGPAARVALRPKISAAGSEEDPLWVLESIRSSHFRRTYDTCVYTMYFVVFPCVSCIKLALAHTFMFARVHPSWFSSCFTHICQGGIWIISLLHTHLFMFSGVRSVWSARSRFFFSVFRCDLYDLRDLGNVFWVGPVRSSSYTFPWWDLYDLDLSHMFAWVWLVLFICMICTCFCLGAICIIYLHDLHMFADCDMYDLRDLDNISLIDVDHISLMGSVWSRSYIHVWLDGIRTI